MDASSNTDPEADTSRTGGALPVALVVVAGIGGAAVVISRRTMSS